MLCKKGVVAQGTNTKVHQRGQSQILCGHIHSGEIQSGEILCGELKWGPIEIGELHSTEVEKCETATLNEFIAPPSLNSRVVGRRGEQKQKQWKPVSSSFSSSAPLKLRAASFKVSNQNCSGRVRERPRLKNPTRRPLRPTPYWVSPMSLHCQATDSVFQVSFEVCGVIL